MTEEEQKVVPPPPQIRLSRIKTILLDNIVLIGSGAMALLFCLFLLYIWIDSGYNLRFEVEGDSKNVISSTDLYGYWEAERKDGRISSLEMYPGPDGSTLFGNVETYTSPEPSWDGWTVIHGKMRADGAINIEILKSGGDVYARGIITMLSATSAQITFTEGPSDLLAQSPVSISKNLALSEGDADRVIYVSLAEALDDIREQTTLPVPFPDELPASFTNNEWSEQYAQIDVGDTGYSITFLSVPGQWSQASLLGSLSASKSTGPLTGVDFEDEDLIPGIPVTVRPVGRAEAVSWIQKGIEFNVELHTNGDDLSEELQYARATAEAFEAQ